MCSKRIFDFVMLARLVLQLGCTLFEVLSDFRKRRAPIGPGKFQAIVLRGIMTRSDVHATVQFPVNDGVGDGRSGSGRAAQQYPTTIRPENGCGRSREIFRKKPRIVTDDHHRGLGVRPQVARNCL